MRESKKTEKTHLPKGSTELWLESLTPAKGEARHRNPPEDSYETWLKKRIKKGRGPPRKARKKRLKGSA